MNEYTICSRCNEKPAAICISCLIDCAEAINKDLLEAVEEFQESIYQLSEGQCILCGGEDYPVRDDKKGYDEVKPEEAEEWILAHKESCPLIKFDSAIAKSKKEGDRE